MGKLLSQFAGLIFGLLFALYFEDLRNLFRIDNNLSLEKTIISSWKSYVHLPDRKLNRNLRIAIGVNTNVDLILSGTELFKALDIKEAGEVKNCQNIGSLGEFKACFKYFFKKGSAAERSFRGSDDFDTVITATQELAKKKHYIGGNAGLMAESISNKFENTNIYLIGPVGQTLKGLLNERIQVPSLIEKDEIHLILEYHANELYEGLESPTANRFIVSHDIYNSNMMMVEQFFESIKRYEPDLIILSGLHLLENQTPITRLDKLLLLKDYLVENHEYKNVIHLELASIGDKALMKAILDVGLLNEVDSLGLNEQELSYLAHSAEVKDAPHSNYYNDMVGQPDILKVIDILEWVLNTYGKSESQPDSRLTRIHFHCLVFHIIVVKADSKWSNNEASVLAGSKIASKQASGFEFHDELNEQELEQLVQLKVEHTLDSRQNIQFQVEADKFVLFDPKKPVMTFERANLQFYFTPTLVCKKPLKTVGLGDAISSVGLIYSFFDHTKDFYLNI